MALIQVNQKLLHITITLLIYGVRIESVKCPEFCHCVETSVFYNVNNTKPDFDILDISDKNSYQHLDISKRSLKSAEVKEVSPSHQQEIVTTVKNTSTLDANLKSETEVGEQRKTLKNKIENSKDIFIHNFSTDPVENFLIKNSKEIRIKRTLKLNVNGTSSNSERLKQNLNKTRLNGGAEGGGGGRGGESGKSGIAENILNEDKFQSAAEELQKNQDSKDKKKGVKEIFTYQITCNEVRDLKALWFQDLPNPTTQLIIQKAYFQSVKSFHQILKESSAKLNQLTDLSVTNCIINQKENESHSSITESPINRKEKEPELEEAPREKKKKSHSEFLPFASLQNPQLRTKPETDPNPEPDGSHLQILNLSNNTLTYLPKDTFQQFPNLQTLDLSNNLIVHLDDEIFNSLGNLLRLDLHNNRIKSLNELVFKNLTKLLTLDVSQNSISNFPPSTFQYLTSLNTLILADNPLSNKEEAMILLGTGKRLQIVDVSKTGLKQIPGTLERSVRTLNLKGNYLSSIQCGDLDSYLLLTYLDLRDNKISYVEDDALGRLELLNNLQINENNLFQIPKSLPNNLEILNLSYNNIQNITNSDFLNLSLLKELSLSYNQVSNIEENSFDNLVQLRILDLSHNPILILPNMYGIVELTILNLSYFTNIPNDFKNRYEEFPAQSPEKIRVLNLESSPILTKIFLQDTKTLLSFGNLQELYLRFSNLTTLRKDIFTLLPKLKRLKIEGNPWHCEKEILKLSEWLRKHEKNTEVNDENEINTAHCATPSNLYKKPLITLTDEDFGGAAGAQKDDPTPYMGIEKVNTKNIFKNQKTLKKIQEIQSKDKIYLKSFQKPIDYSDKKIEEMSNTSQRNKIDFTIDSPTSKETKIKKDKKTDSTVKLLLNYNKTEHKRVISDSGEGKCCKGSENLQKEDDGSNTVKLFDLQKSSTSSSAAATTTTAAATTTTTTTAAVVVASGAYALADKRNSTDVSTTALHSTIPTITAANVTSASHPVSITDSTSSSASTSTPSSASSSTSTSIPASISTPTTAPVPVPSNNRSSSITSTATTPTTITSSISSNTTSTSPSTPTPTFTNELDSTESIMETTTNAKKLVFHNLSTTEVKNELTTGIFSEVSQPETVLVKETLSSEKHRDSHPGIFVVSFVGLIMVATLAVTFLHFAKTRRDRNYQRQNQDIEVRSISSLGNELW